MHVLLTLNSGSSSIKFQIFSLEEGMEMLAGGKVVDIGNKPIFSAAMANGPKETKELLERSRHNAAIDTVIEWLDAHPEWTLAAAAHRIVHGGPHLDAPARLTPELMEELRALTPLALLHQPHNLAGVEILAKKLPHMPQYGCFDTAFHAHQEPLYFNFALPKDLRDQGVRRYGFHGLSYDWVANHLRTDLPHLANKRVVAAHLGNGSSLCAIHAGRSVDTTMGLTVLDGLPMGTRCGNIDAGAVIYMQRTLGMNVDEVEDVLYNKSGLKGLSGISNDVKTLQDSPAAEARFALDYYILKTAQHIASLAVSMGGMDALVFTGGIGENSDIVRNGVLKHLAFMPKFETHIILANEERSMAESIMNRFADDIRESMKQTNESKVDSLAQDTNKKPAMPTITPNLSITQKIKQMFGKEIL